MNKGKIEIKIPISENEKLEIIGKGIVEALCEKQKRIERLERLLFVLHENICKGVESDVLFDNDLESLFFTNILKKFKELKK